MAKFGIAGALAGAALTLYPVQAGALKISAEKPETPVVAITERCKWEGEMTRQEVMDIINSLDFYIGSFESWPNRAGKKTEEECIDREVGEYCWVVGNTVFGLMSLAFDTQDMGINKFAAHFARDAEAKCTKAMYSELDKK